MEHHPDKNIGVDTNEMFNKIRQAYEILSDPALRQNYRNSAIAQQEREKRYEMQTKEIRKFREELLRREREHKDKKEADISKSKGKSVNIRKKREREEEDEGEIRNKFGRNTVRVEWKDDTAYTELMIAQILTSYGPVKRIQVSKSSKFAYVEFEHPFSAVSVIREKMQRNPPEEFETRFLNNQEYAELNSQKATQKVSSGVDSDSSVLAHRMRRFLEKVKQSNL